MFEFLNSIPFVSQVKSLIEVASGDDQAAKHTQEEFLDGAPVVSQIHSLVQAIQGDNEGAKRSQMKFLNSQIQQAVGLLTLPFRLAGELQPSRPISESLTPRTDWMSKVYGLCLHELLIPGTHDSATYHFDSVTMLGLAQAQILTIRQQLDGGIRFLDIRVNKNSDGVLYGSHSAITVPLSTILDDVKNFLEANPKEKIIYRTSWDGSGDGDLELAKVEADKRFQGWYVNWPTLAKPLGLWGEEKLLYLVKLSGKDEDFEGIHQVTYNSYNETATMDPENVVVNCNNWVINKERKPYQLNLLACQATPMQGSTIDNIVNLSSTGLSLRAAAGRSNYQIADKLLTNPQAIMRSNIINMDFADDGLIGQIIKLNATNFEEQGYISVPANTDKAFDAPAWVVKTNGDRIEWALIGNCVTRYNSLWYFKAAVTPVQNAWRWCGKCRALYFKGIESKNVCAAGGVHDDLGQYGDGSGFLTIGLPYKDNQANLQDGWRQCKKCSALYFGESGYNSKCTAQGAHEHNGWKFKLLHDITPPSASQNGWRWCNKCGILHWAEGIPAGSCAAGGTHNNQSSNYIVGWEVPFGYRECRKCKTLFYLTADHKNCCTDGKLHDPTGTSFYFLTGRSFGQNNWWRCKKCASVYYGSNTKMQSGKCPADGGNHLPFAGNFSLQYNPQPSEVACWRYCNKCGVIHKVNEGNIGLCPAGGNHSTEGSGNYVIIRAE